MLIQHQKQLIVQEVRQRLADYARHISLPSHVHGICLYLAGLAVAVLKRHAVPRPLIQAGTCFWRCLAPADDDGVAALFYGYEWEPDHPLSRLSMAMGDLPEMHVWVGFPDTHEILDLSLPSWPLLCRQADLRWTMPEPPDFFWGIQDQLPPGTRYQPHLEACRFTVHTIARQNKIHGDWLAAF
jgi:hypothetical protein